jgi:hypothetical protein
MATKKSTNISLGILGGAALLTLGYFAWLFLAPSASVSVVEHVSQGSFDKTVVESKVFQNLQPFVSLPIVSGQVGRPNPFEDLPPVTTEQKTNVNSNTPSAPSGTVVSPLINTPVLPGEAVKNQ